tara:strand:- start:178 stop:345 length:168 start_codon:yes stop_codon:yes gene_type:complete
MKKKKIRSISLSEKIDEQLINDSDFRGLTVSANLTRILYEYFQNNSLNGKTLDVR